MICPQCKLTIDDSVSECPYCGCWQLNGGYDAEESCKEVADYRRKHKQAEQESRTILDKYTQKLDYYITNGSADDRKYAKILKQDSALSCAYVLLFIVVIVAFCSEITWTLIFPAALVLHIVFVKVRLKKAIDYFKDKDSDVINTRNSYDFAINKTVKAQNELNDAKKDAITTEISLLVDEINPISPSAAEAHRLEYVAEDKDHALVTPENYCRNQADSAISNSVNTTKWLVIGIILIGIVAIFIWIAFWNNFLSPGAQNARVYREACFFAEGRNYDEALARFQTIRGYKDTNRYISGISAISYASTISDKLENSTWGFSLLGMEVYGEYYPLDYTFVEVIVIPSDGLIGILSSYRSLFGEDVTYDEAGMQKMAKDLYNDYFASTEYKDITVVVELRDYANGNHLSGAYTAY